MRFFTYIFILCGCLFSFSYAETMQCSVKKGTRIVAHFFDANDEKNSKVCIDKPIVYVTASGKTIRSSIKENPNIRQQDPSQIVEPILANMNCGGSGGTVKSNGKVFHLDPAALCEKYETKGKGSITAGISRHIKLQNVDANFRKKISPFVTQTALKYGMEPEFIHAVISAESAYKPNATSHAGAMGLMQLMPFTAKRFGVSNAYNPEQNIDAGTRYLKLLYDEFGSLELAAAGYNAGEGAVRKYNNSIPPFKETRAYVPKVMAYYHKYKQDKSLISAR